jgi:hypothetical protein
VSPFSLLITVSNWWEFARKGPHLENKGTLSVHPRELRVELYADEAMWTKEGYVYHKCLLSLAGMLMFSHEGTCGLLGNQLSLTVFAMKGVFP